MPSPPIETFKNAFNQHADRLRAFAAGGNRIIGYFCTYTPVEIIHAAGFLPVRITGGAGRVERAYALAPDFICPYMKRALEKAITGEYDYLSGVVQGYTCDVSCGLVNIWKDNVPGELFVNIALPYNDTADGRAFYRVELENLIEKLRAVGGTLTPETLHRSIALYNDIRDTLYRVMTLTYAGKTDWSAEDLLTLNLAATVTPPERFSEMLEPFKEEMSSDTAPPAATGVPVLVSGSLIESPAVMAAIREAGGRVVADDLCTGMRPLSAVFPPADDPIDWLVERHFLRVPCPTRVRAEARLPALRRLIAASGARGVVFLLQKFCTPHLADLPELTERLKAEQIPSMVIELDEQTTLGGQIRTRLESFFETIQ